MIVALALLTLLGGCALQAGGALGLGSSGAGGGGGGGGGGSGSSNGRLAMPNLIGMTRDEARRTLAAAGFKHGLESSRVVECVDPPRVPGKINCQDPLPGVDVAVYAIVQINVYETPKHNGRIVREQLESLVGLTIEAARERLRSFGHVGEVEVAPSTNKHYAGCADGTVCEVGTSGATVRERIALITNTKLKISTPAD